MHVGGQGEKRRPFLGNTYSTDRLNDQGCREPSRFLLSLTFPVEETRFVAVAPTGKPGRKESGVFLAMVV